MYVYNNGWQRRLARNEFFLLFKPAHAGHAHVSDQYTDLIGFVRIQELFRTAKAPYPVAVGFQQPAQGVAYGFVVIDDKNGVRCLRCSHACNSWVSSVVLGACGSAQGRVKRKMVPPSGLGLAQSRPERKSTRLNSSH